MFLLKEVSYKDILTIKNLHIPKQKITCIVGESGSGKTTLLRLLNRLTSYDSGEIFYQNQLIKDIDPVELRRNVVMLPQTPAIFSGTIKDNLLIGLKFSEKTMPTDQQLGDMLKLVHLKKDLDQDAEKLSGGEKQRVALGRVILMQPEVLLLDEPSSALDEETEHTIIEALVNYSKENKKTLIMVTHSTKLASEFADEIIKIKEGQFLRKEEVSK
ncbi:putative ABC transport system ATP-binding protein [Natronobacillus azotifigens]|uniref:ABC transporter ATP-binding protein n=1 Tax=Natronobacillus azotifigens TaxID=472978 RepID=A0A9J6RC76_9BACI|nr:ABC transporter ATP-binding protein [Natronobacillus azotifigens]MCZ0702947.1 ABC transporter ATP-binding protein [Natronobacillus azotifigens]